MQNIESTATRRVIIYGLAVVGFTTLIGAGIWLALYSARFVPETMNRLGAAAVSLSQIFLPAPAYLSVVPTASTTISFGDNSSATPTTTIATPIVPAKPRVIARTPGQETSGVFPIGSSTPAVLSGLPDLILRLDGVGYFASSTADSFIATSTVPNGSRPAVQFTITNSGTNVAGPWRFSATIPTQTNYLYQSQLQQSLNPGDRIQYTLGFDQANRGSDQPISITANFDRSVAESNFNNNTVNTKITILGN